MAEETPFRIRWLDAVFSDRGPPHHNHRLIATVLFRYMNPDGTKCFPSTTTIAKVAALAERSVRTRLIEMEELGWIQRRIRSAYTIENPGRDWRRYIYTPFIPAEGAALDTAPQPRKQANE